MKDFSFTLKETSGKDISLKDYLGKNVIVYFYPKDDTSGWTTEANGFRDLKQEFDKLNTVILGISRDSLKSHEKFIAKNELNFLLLSDKEEVVHNLFQVMVPKKMYGKDYIGVERSTFIFDKEGELVKEFRNVKPEGHADEVLNYIKENL